MDEEMLAALPGGDLVLEGLRNLERGEETVPALLVLIGASKLRSLGIDVPVRENAIPPEHQLYERLGTENADTAHSRYNALVGRLVSFERALSCASA